MFYLKCEWCGEVFDTIDLAKDHEGGEVPVDVYDDWTPTYRIQSEEEAF